MDSPTPSFTVTTEQQGASYVAEHLVRKVKIYPITEVELNTMTLFNTISAAAFSGAAFVVGVCATIWWDVQTNPGAPTQTLGWPLLIVLLSLAVGCLAIAVWAHFQKGGTIDRMIHEAFVVRDGKEIPVASLSK